MSYENQLRVAIFSFLCFILYSMEGATIINKYEILQRIFNARSFKCALRYIRDHS